MNTTQLIARLKEAIKTRENQIAKFVGQKKRALKHHRVDIADECDRKIEVLRVGNTVDARVLEEYKALEDQRAQGLVIQTEEDLDRLRERRQQLVSVR